MAETWRPIRVYPNVYVSDRGGVRLDKKLGTLTFYNDRKEPCVEFTTDGQSYSGDIRTLVVWGFYGGRLSGIVISTHDGDVSNNHIDNIKFEDPMGREVLWRENNWAGRRIIDRRLRPPVRNVNTGAMYATAAEAAFDINGSPAGVSMVLRGAREKYLGYIFEYV